jgi:endonuclease/exonuclease/phosphatase family metal-dependent hydrolase
LGTKNEYIMKLKVITWNIWGGRFLGDIIAFLKETDTDIVLLQEIIKDEDGGNTALTIAKALGYEPPVYNLDMFISSKWTGPIRDKEATLNFGNAIISKYPIESWKSYDLSPNDSRMIVGADIRVGDKIIHAFSIHLKHNHIGDKFNPAFDVLQVEQTNNLLNILPQEKR